VKVNRPFADCKVADLHLADAIQSFGAMVVVDEGDTVVAVSANSEAFLGAPPQDLLGTDARRSLPPGIDLDEIRARGAGVEPGGPIRLRLSAVEVDDRASTAAVHARAGMVIAEVQAPGDHDAALGEAGVIVQRLADRLENAAAPEDAARVLMDAVADLVGFDRVMLYRFLPDWHGEVLAERLAPGVDGYLGLRFPEGDIPANARRLYLAKRQRIIADVHAATVPVVGVREGMTLDLAGSELRAVHPTHLEYLANMGVAASFSVSIVVEGRLWGMVACHHFAPRRLGLVTRQACEMLTTIASLQIANLQRVRHVREMERHRVALDATWHALESSDAARREAALPRLREVFAADGVLGRIGGRSCHDGAVPVGGAATRLRDLVERWPDDAVTAGSQVPRELADDPDAARCASGVLHVPFGADGYVCFLRREQVETVAWAGRPPSADGSDAAHAALTPRASFAIWREDTRGRAAPWTAAEVESAERLRTLLVERQERVELERRATTDELTGLANRAAFEEALGDVLADVRRAGEAVLAIDLDRFKEVNDAFGHPVGDDVLAEVAQRLRATLRVGDLAARLGGDEFAALLHGVSDASALADVAARVVRVLGEPYLLDEHAVDVGASVGAAFVANAGDTVDAVMARVDEALYAAKRAGRGRYALAGASDDGATRTE
jgi:diguanylate cyclase (GGDEF)-like protein